MSRTDGFAVMDVSTDVANDPKFRRVQRRNPDHTAAVFMVYMSVLGESWKAGRRVSVIDAWPVLLVFDETVVAALEDSELLDSKGFLPAKAWAGWYKEAQERREKSRVRWKRYNDKRASESVENHVSTAFVPRGNHVVTTSSPRFPSRPFRSVPSDPSGLTDSPSAGAREGGTPSNDLWPAVQRLGEELTGIAYAFPNPFSGYGAMALSQAESCEWSVFEGTYRKIAKAYGQPTPKQLTFDAENLLRPAGLVGPEKEEPPTREQVLAFQAKKKKEAQNV